MVNPDPDASIAEAHFRLDEIERQLAARQADDDEAGEGEEEESLEECCKHTEEALQQLIKAVTALTELMAVHIADHVKQDAKT